MPKNGLRFIISNISTGEQIFKSLLVHPMETGERKDKKTGKKIPADYIEKFTFSVDGEVYLDIDMGVNFSKNPLICFGLDKPVKDQQKVTIRWTDNHGLETVHTSTVSLSNRGRHSYRSHKKEVRPAVTYETTPGVTTSGAAAPGPAPTCKLQRRSSSKNLPQAN